MPGAAAGCDVELSHHRRRARRQPSLRPLDHVGPPPYRSAMDRRRFLLTSLAGMLVTPLRAVAQHVVYRIGVLSPEAPPPGFLENFRAGLRELGYVDGRTITLELRNAGGNIDRLTDLADELVRLKVHIIVTINTSAALAAKKATATIPIVITRVANPVKSGLVPSLSHPGGNLTGLTALPDELGAKQLQLLKELLPRLSRVAALWNAHNPGGAIVVKDMEPSAVALGLQLLPVSVGSSSEFVGAFEAAARGRAEALYVNDDAFMTRHRVQILDLADKHSLPVLTTYKDFVEAGGLIAYGASPAAIYKRAAVYVDKILRGAKPADLPIEQPTTFELVLNLRTAKSLGLTIPPALLLRADHVVK